MSEETTTVWYHCMSCAAYGYVCIIGTVVKYCPACGMALDPNEVFPISLIVVENRKPEDCSPRPVIELVKDFLDSSGARRYKYRIDCGYTGIRLPTVLHLQNHHGFTREAAFKALRIGNVIDSRRQDDDHG